MTINDQRTDVNVATTKRIYAAVPAGELEVVLGLLDPEVRIQYIGTDAIPYAGDFHGIDGATDFFTRVGTAAEVVSMEPRLFITEGDHVAVWGELVLKAHHSGREFASEFAHIITLRDGRWLHFRDFANSAEAAEVFADA